VKGDSHHCVADGLKYGRCNYESKNLHDAEMFSRVFRLDNLFRFDCKTGRVPTRRPYVWGFESSLGRGVSHDAVRPNATGIQIRLRISRIFSSSQKQLWVGHVFFRFGTRGLQELVEAEEFAAGLSR